MDFYGLKNKAALEIGKRIKDSENYNISILYLFVLQDYGLSPKFVDTYLETLKDNGLIMIDNKKNTVTWI